MAHKYGQNIPRLTSRLLMTSTLQDYVSLVKSCQSFRNNCFQLILAEKLVTNINQVGTNLNVDYVIVVRLHDLNKNIRPYQEKFFHQTWVAERLRRTNLVQNDLIVTDAAVKKN